MKKIIYLLSVIILVSCNSENAPDCFQNSGDVITKTFEVQEFTKVTVFERIELIVKEGPVHEVIVETGEFLMDEIDVKVENGKLLLNNNNGCNLTRDFGITKIYITAPNLTEIRSSTGLQTSSDGVLTYPSLLLISEDFSEAYHTDGLFRLQVNCNTLKVIVNNLSTSSIEGSVENLNIQFFSGDARFEGRNLIAQNINIYHRGSNDITINPQVSLTANLVGTGDVIVVNTPPIVDVQEQYTGRVIFE
ncbi:head GIN domain-containing protein [Lacinutrix sp. Hel_I_90]|uniref:head GIN domain-containing protein n=1 Tax=Lacinutrix sp. Hel_I_90 TaxID=1249999 RepID=UPI0005CAE82F|nr:head GIN domain-containing protein [Lacinutrix sp. Hel_I_90]